MRLVTCFRSQVNYANFTMCSLYVFITNPQQTLCLKVSFKYNKHFPGYPLC